MLAVPERVPAMMFRQPVPASKFTAIEHPFEWIWPGFLATGCTTLLTGEWKAGKTTLLSILLSRFGIGGTIAGRPVRPVGAVGFATGVVAYQSVDDFRINSSTVHG